MSRRTAKRLSLESLETRQVLDAAVVFNEIMYNPPATDESLEWIELHNVMAVDMDISNWRLDEAVEYEFPSGTVVPAGGYIVVAANPTALAAAGIYTGAKGPWTGSLDNDGEEIELKNNSDRLLDIVDYNDNGDWPSAPDGSGTTLAKPNPMTSSEAAASWRSSQYVGGTPGSVNVPPPGELTLPAEVVSFWNFDEISGSALDSADSNHGALGAGATRVPGAIGSGAVSFNDTPNSVVNVGTGTGNNYSVTNGITVEAIVKPTWDGVGSSTIFKKNSSVGAPLISYWSFDETNTTGNSSVLDSIGGNNGTLTGTAVHTTGIRGLGAGRFTNLAAEGVTLTSGVNNNFSVTAGITIAAWIKPEWGGGILQYDTIFNKADGANRVTLEFQREASTISDPPQTGSVRTLGFGLNTNGVIRELDMPLDVNLSALANGTPNSGTIYLTAPGGALGPNDVVLRDGNPHHVAATYDVATGEKAMYVDGVKRWFFNYAPGSPVATGGAAVAVIGNTTVSGPCAFQGVIDEVAYFGDALTAAQVAALATTGSPIDLPSATGIENKVQLAFQNDGNNGAANPPVAAGPVLSFGVQVGGTYSELDVPLDGVAGRPTLASLQNGQPHHIAATYDKATGEKAIWVDGVQIGMVNLGVGSAIVTGGDGSTAIGNNRAQGTDSFSGVIDEVAYWNKGLTAAEVAGHSTAISAGENYFAAFNPSPAALAINEIAPAGAGFWLELVNYGTTPVNLGGRIIAGSENPLHRYVLPSQVLAFGEYLTVTAAQMGFAPALDGDRIFLIHPSERLIEDAVTVDNELRGRLPVGTGPWLFPNVATPGAANSIPLHDEIAINEIMYHAKPQYTEDAQTNITRPVTLTSSWQYNQSNTDLGATNWKDVGYTPTGWSTGPAALGVISGATAYQALVQGDTPLAYWRLGDTGPGVSDISGNGRNGTAEAGVTFNQNSLLLTDTANKAINTNGTPRVIVPGFQKFPAGSTGYSVEYWIKLSAPLTATYNIVGDGESANDWYLMNYLLPGGQIRPHFNGAGTVSTDSNGTLQVGPTYHVVTTWDRTAGLGSIYVNGVLDKAVNIGTAAPINTDNQIYIGRDNREPGGNFMLDEVAIYNRPLSLSEISEHYAAGGGVVFATPLNLGPTTYYFRNEFNFTGNPAITTLQLRSLVDDGAVFYLNGQEIYRKNLGDGTVNHATLASPAVGVPTMGTVVNVNATLQAGANVLAVEVHQASVSDNDVAFSAELIATETQQQQLDFEESIEEWVELYNRSNHAVDLSGWELDDAVSYTFPAGTTLAAGEYLVVAENALALAVKYPTARILGNYNGTLANSSERIQLKDARKNPADEVTYADEGRWSIYADGGGSSLELRDPDADNSSPEAWAPSNESGRSGWQTYTYRGTASNPPNTNNPTTYNEFILGLLDSGEVLLDDISVRENPSGANTQFIQNTNFEGDAVGGAANKWRLVGNHSGTVIVDPNNAANKVLRMVATGQAEHMANHAETTLKAGANFETIILGTEYEISFKAKWIAGSPQLNSRLFFNLLPKTTVLEQSPLSGTPGARNSTLAGATEAVANVGPTYTGFSVTPVTPAAQEPVTVRVAAADPNGIQSMSVKYSVNGGATQSAVMTLSGGVYSGTITGQAANAIVQFYVEGQDTAGAISTFPAKGAASRALFKVGNAATAPNIHNLQIIMTTADSAALNAATNLMSNGLRGATVVYQGKAYYDVGVRLKGSEHGRPNTDRRGFTVYFAPDDLFRGVHSSIGLDRSGGWRYSRQLGQEEIVIQHFIQRAGNIPGSYTDLVNIEAPGMTHATSTAILQMGRFTNSFLDSQYENGADGTRYEFELVYTMLPGVGGDVESVKVPQEGPSVFGVPIRDKGDDKEAYRHNFLIKNNTDEDTYNKKIDEDTFKGVDAMAEALGVPTSNPAFHPGVADVIDVDQWLRAFAAISLAAVSDSYFNNSNNHNATFYQRPSDGKMLLFPQDLDFAFINGTNSALVGNSDLANLLTLPHNNHFFLGHVHDIVTTAYNATYMGPWVNHYNSKLTSSPIAQNITDLTAFINTRANFALSQLPANVPFTVSSTPPTPVITTLIGDAAVAAAFVPTAADGSDLTWTTPGFVPSGWQTGTTGIGYQDSIGSDNVDYRPLFGLSVTGMSGVNSSVYTRLPFSFTGNAADVDNLKLRMKYDDGFVAYLNGTKVAEANAPVSPTWNSTATVAHDDVQAIVFQDFDITAFKHLLVPGSGNVLAIHGLNLAVVNSDFLISANLVTEDIPVSGGGVLEVNGPTVTIGGTGWVNVREIRLVGEDQPLPVTWTSNTAWQTVVQLEPGEHVYTFQAYDFQGNSHVNNVSVGTGSLTINSTQPRPLIDYLRISELMYHPGDPTVAEFNAGFTDADDFEYVELVNTSATQALTLTGAEFNDGINYVFPVPQPLSSTPSRYDQINGVIDPRGRIVIARNPAAFAARYGSAPLVVGPYSGALNNAGEHLRLIDADGGTIHNFTYDDTGAGWHPSTDGLGYSLVIVRESDPVINWNNPVAWRPSHELGGSPGERDLIPGDINGDDRVDLLDLVIQQLNFGAISGATRSQGDLNRDGAIARTDTAILAANLGRLYTPPAPPAPVAPSPAAALTGASGSVRLPAVERVLGPSAASQRISMTATRVTRPADPQPATSTIGTSLSALRSTRLRRAVVDRIMDDITR